MGITLTLINLKNSLSSEQEEWLLKNIGPRLHYTHMSVGGIGWIVKKNFKPSMVDVTYTLGIEDEKKAILFILKFL